MTSPNAFTSRAGATQAGAPRSNDALAASARGTADESPRVEPHPLANELTAPVAAADAPNAPSGGPRRASGRAIALTVGVVALLAAAISAVFFHDQRHLLLIGAAVVLCYLVLVGAPAYLALGAKAAQDEAVRQGATADAPRPSQRMSAGSPASQAASSEELP